MVEVVALVCVQFGGPPTAWTISRTDRRDAAHERDQSLAVVQIGTRDAHGEGQSVAIADDMNLRSQLAAVGRIRSGQRPPLTARTLAESIAHRDHSNSPLAPSWSSMTRCSVAHTRFFDQHVKRRWTACQDAPKTGGSCRHVHPDVATKMIAASTARPSHRRRPPPCIRVGGFGATFRKISHNPSGRSRSAVPMPEQRLNANQDIA